MAAHEPLLMLRARDIVVIGYYAAINIVTLILLLAGELAVNISV